MIRVNLLPEELRRTGGTPPVMLGVLLGGVALVALLGCAYAYLWFDVIVLDTRLANLSTEVSQLNAQAAEVDSLQEDITDYKERERIIIQIKTNRILWSRKLDSLATMTPPEIWITKLKVKKEDERRAAAKSGKGKAGKFMELECFALGADVKTMTEFRSSLMGEREFWNYFIDEAIAANDFSYGFASISPPSWEKVALPGFREENNIRFTIRLDLKQQDDAVAAAETKPEAKPDQTKAPKAANS
jgi:Tfp pilus assembly protein PilN